MQKAIIGKKIGMTQLFDEKGNVVPVTVVEAGPCVVVQKKTIENDGYEAVQIGFGALSDKRATKAIKGHFAKADVALKKTLKEFRLDDIAALNVDIGSSGSCQVATSTIQVSLGTVNRGEFHGKGTTGGQAKRFSIPVFCPTPTDVRIGFFGVSVESDTLALSQASNSASGVGVKLTYGNNPGAAVPDGTSVKINEASNLPILKRVTGASAGTAEAINFNAQYVQTDATVGAGTANSMVTFALEYN